MKMNVRPIRTEADYDRVLKEIARYFDAKTGNAGGQSLRRARDIEDKHWPIDPPDPVDAIRRSSFSRHAL
jgi:HTH-type transcriptional regulator/antitoxin HigA